MKNLIFILLISLGLASCSERGPRVTTVSLLKETCEYGKKVELIGLPVKLTYVDGSTKTTKLVAWPRPHGENLTGPTVMTNVQWIREGVRNKYSFTCKDIEKGNVEIIFADTNVNPLILLSSEPRYRVDFSYKMYRIDGPDLEESRLRILKEREEEEREKIVSVFKSKDAKSKCIRAAIRDTERLFCVPKKICDAKDTCIVDGWILKEIITEEKVMYFQRDKKSCVKLSKKEYHECLPEEKCDFYFPDIDDHIPWCLIRE